MTTLLSPETGSDPRRGMQPHSAWLAAAARAELEGLDPLSRSAALACAVPRWFNAPLMAELMGGTLPVEMAAQIIERMRGWEFVRSLGQGRLNYREAARAGLLAGFESGPALRVLHERAHAYFDRLLDLPYGALDESAWLRLSTAQFNLLREKVYHLLRLDPERGYALFRVLFRGAHSWYLPGEAEALLLTTRGLDLQRLPPGAREELALFEAIQAAADYRYAEAEAALKALYNQPMDAVLRGRVWSELGKLYSLTGRLPEAVRAFEQAQVSFRTPATARESAATANNMGSVYLGMREPRRARQAFEQALAALRQVGTPADQALAYNNLGTAYEREEDWTRALAYYERSLAMKEEIGDRFGAARTRVNIGSVYHAQIRDVDDARRAAKLRQSAEELYAQSLATFRQFGARSEAAKVQYKQALLYYQFNELEQARALLPEVLEEYRALGIPGVELVERLAERLEAA